MALLEIPECQLFQVTKTGMHLLMTGPFQIIAEGPIGQVGPVEWPLGRDVSSLRFSDITYTFQQKGVADTYLCLCLDQRTPPDMVAALQQLLPTVTAYFPSADARAPVEPPPGAAAALAASHAAGTVAAVAPAHEPLQPGAAPGAPAPPPGAGPPQHSGATRLALTIVATGKMAGKIILGSARLAAAGVTRAADMATHKMRPAAQPTHVSPQTQARLDNAKHVAGQAAEVTSKVATQVIAATGVVAGKLAEKLASSNTVQGAASGHGTMVGGVTSKDCVKVGVAGLQAYEAVAESLVQAARIVVKGLQQDVPRVVEHKYGPEAAHATSTGLEAAGSAAHAVLNVQKLRPTAIAKKVVTTTAKETVAELNNGRTDLEDVEGTLIPLAPNTASSAVPVQMAGLPMAAPAAAPPPQPQQMLAAAPGVPPRQPQQLLQQPQAPLQQPVVAASPYPAV